MPFGLSPSGDQGARRSESAGGRRSQLPFGLSPSGDVKDGVATYETAGVSQLPFGLSPSGDIISMMFHRQDES